MTRFTLRQIEAFYWCAMLGTVHAAAQHLHISQPAVSTRIKELEDALQLTLFSRSHQRIELTAAGRKALSYAERLLRAGHELQQLGGSTVPLQGVLRFGADETGAAVAATELLRQIKLLHPALKVELSLEVSKVLREKLARREIDLALHGTALQRPNVVDELLGHVSLTWIAASGFDAGPAPLTPERAVLLPIVTNPAPSILHGLVKDWLHVSGYEFNSFSSCNSIAMIIRLVQSGHAIAALPVPVVAEALKNGLVRRIETRPPVPSMPYYISYLDDKMNSGIQDIVALVKSILISADFFAELAAQP
ncbi:LysR family transcriptional regulator [Xylophilus rhododendri]|uniref:LysR family transcriptional regulator n=1 Tax=Xylophilus rhododendri TaxID=2697032 RepID=A0A857J763_9BURK|nr:LysR family transcriptional regulator [Xylophilus rhododendri]QHI99860.1 LysR family transcriptional regulator [Xylophilus rhododendri]